MPRGYDRPLYIQPFDHRGSFQTKMFGWQSPLSERQTAEVAASKAVVYDGFRRRSRPASPRRRPASWLTSNSAWRSSGTPWPTDTRYSCPAEKAARRIRFRVRRRFRQAHRGDQPDLCKVLVRYNPEGDREMNQRQAARLRELSDYLAARGRMFMFELLVPAEPTQLDKVGNDKRALGRRATAGVDGRSHPRTAGRGIEAGLWKIEGLDRRNDCVELVAAAREGGDNKVGCIVLGRGEDDRRSASGWASPRPVPGFIGFAVGRTAFWDPLVAWRSRHASVREQVRGRDRPALPRMGGFVRAQASLLSPRSSVRPEHRSSMEG